MRREIGFAPRDRIALGAGGGMGNRPAAGDGVGRPVEDAQGISADDQMMKVVAHHRVGEDVDGEGSGGGADGLAHPVAAVLGVIAAEKGTADAAGDAGSSRGCCRRRGVCGLWA